MGKKAKSNEKKKGPSKVKAKSPTRTKSRPKPPSSSPTKTESSSITEVVRATSDVAEFAAKGSRNFLRGLWDDFASSISQGHNGAVLSIAVVDEFFNPVPPMRRKRKAFSNVKSKVSNQKKPSTLKQTRPSNAVRPAGEEDDKESKKPQYVQPKWLFSGGRDGYCRQYDITTCQSEYRFSNVGPVQALLVGNWPKAKVPLLILGSDKGICIFDLKGLARVHHLEIGNVKSLIQGPRLVSSKHVNMAYAATDSGVVEVDVATGERKRTFPGKASMLALVKNDTLFCASTETPTIMCYSLNAGKCKRKFKAFDKPLRTMAYWSPQNFLVCSDSSFVKVYDGSSFQEVNELLLPCEDPTDIALLGRRGDTRALFASSQGECVLCDVETGERLNTYEHEGKVNACLLTCAKHVFTAGDDAMVKQQTFASRLTVAEYGSFRTESLLALLAMIYEFGCLISFPLAASVELDDDFARAALLMRGQTKSYMTLFGVDNATATLLLGTEEGVNKSSSPPISVNASMNGTLGISAQARLSSSSSADGIIGYGASSTSILLAAILIFLVASRATASAQKVVRKLSDKMKSSYESDHAEVEKHREELASLAAFSNMSWLYIQVFSTILFMPVLENITAIFQMNFSILPVLLWPCRVIALLVAVAYVIICIRLSRLGGDVHALNKSWWTWNKDVIARKSFYFSMNSASVGSLLAYEVIETFLSCALVVFSTILSQKLFSFALVAFGAVMLATMMWHPPYQRPTANAWKAALVGSLLGANTATALEAVGVKLAPSHVLVIIIAGFFCGLVVRLSLNSN